MSEETSHDEHREALEDEFFDENQEKIHGDVADAASPKDELRRASGMTDDVVLDKLLALGITGRTAAAMSLVPLIWVAWADGVIQPNERVAIMNVAPSKGLEPGTPGLALLESWLREPPPASLYEAWEAYIKSLTGDLNSEQLRILRTHIVDFARVIAECAGGFMGIGKVSSSEEKVLARIARALEG